MVIVEGDLKFVGQSKYVKERNYVKTPEDGIALIKTKYAKPGEKFFMISETYEEKNSRPQWKDDPSYRLSGFYRQQSGQATVNHIVIRHNCIPRQHEQLL